MILSPQPQVSAPPSLAEVLAAAKNGEELIGTLEVVGATPTTEVPADVEGADREKLVETVIESLTAVAATQSRANDAEEEVAATAAAPAPDRAAAIQKSLDEVLPMLLNEIADLERCVRRANEEADRANRHLAQARRWVAKIVAAAEMTDGAAVVRLSVPGQRASVELAAAAAAAEDEQDGPIASQGRW